MNSMIFDAIPLYEPLDPNKDDDILLVQVALSAIARQARDGGNAVLQIPPPRADALPTCALVYVPRPDGGYLVQPDRTRARAPCPDEPAKLWAFAIVLAEAGPGYLPVTGPEIDLMPNGQLHYAVDDDGARMVWTMA